MYLISDPYSFFSRFHEKACFGIFSMNNYRQNTILYFSRFQKKKLNTRKYYIYVYLFCNL